MPRITAAVTAALLGLVALGVGPSASVTAATAAELEPLTFRATPVSLPAGSSVTLKGRFPGAAAKREVWLQREGSAGSWSTSKTVSTAADGSFSGSLKLSKKGTYRFRARLIATSTSAAVSSPTRAVSVVAKPSKSKRFTKTVKPSVSGTLRVGSTLKASPGAWKPKPSSFKYRWLRDGVAISGATSSSYTLAPANAGSYVTVEVRAQRKKTWTTRESTTGTAVTFGVLGSLSVTVQGTPSVGETLTAAAAAGQPTPEAYRYQWTRNAVAIPGATRATYRLVLADAGTDVAVQVTALRAGYASREARSPSQRVAEAPVDDPVESRPTFGDLMRPASTSVLPSSAATVDLTDREPPWFPANTFVRWDAPGAFTHSLDPAPFGTLQSLVSGSSFIRADLGAEYSAGNPMHKNADVSFVVTGKRFAVRYLTHRASDAMLWLDGRPVAATAFQGKDAPGTGSWNWLVVNRASSEPVTVRLAGPTLFGGVDLPSADGGSVRASTPPFTLGVVSDSIYETVVDARPYHQNGASQLSTLTGFRVWNMSEGGTGYVNEGSTATSVPEHKRPSRYGSPRRIAAIAQAPVDALLVSGSLNDRYWAADTHLTALHQFLDDVARVRPDLPVVLVTLEPLSFHGVEDRSYQPFRVLNANFAEVAAQHANVVGVIDPYTADWFTGTGSTSDPKGDGNQDLYIGADGIHPNAAGQVYWQGRVVTELRTMPARLER